MQTLKRFLVEYRWRTATGKLLERFECVEAASLAEAKRLARQRAQRGETVDRVEPAPKLEAEETL